MSRIHVEANDDNLHDESVDDVTEVDPMDVDDEDNYDWIDETKPNQDEGVHDDEIEDDIDDDQTKFFSKFIMKIGGNKKTRGLAKRYYERVRNIILTHHLFRDPLGTYAANFPAKELTKNSGVYAILSQDGKSIIKIGMTTNFLARLGQYVENDGLENWRFVVLVDLGGFTEEAEDEFQSLYDQFVKEMSTDVHLHPFQRFFFRQLSERGGDRLGPKRIIWLQLIESAFQDLYKVSSPQEFLMFDEAVAGLWYSVTQEETDNLVGLLSLILEMAKADGGLAMFMHSVVSWVPGFTGISSTISAVLSIVRDKQKYSDPIPFPAVPNPTTTDEMYSTKEYTAKHKMDGRNHVREIMDILMRSLYGIVFLDTNKLIFDQDPESGYKSVEEFLQDECGLLETGSFLFGQIRVFQDAFRTHAVLVHGPLCIATDLRPFIKEVYKIRRGIVIAVLNNLARRLRGEPPLSKTDDFMNPINAMLVQQTVRHGMHQSLFQANAFSKDAMTAELVNALLQNGLQKLPVKSFIAINLVRRHHTKRGQKYAALADAGKVRCDNHVIVQQAARLFIRVPAGEEANAYATAMTLFDADGKGLQAARWKQLTKLVEDGSEIQGIMKQLRHDNVQNVGNSNARGHTKEEKTVKKSALDLLVEQYGPRNGEP